MKKSFFAVVASATFLITGIGANPAQAVTNIITCSGGGGFTVTDNVTVRLSGEGCSGAAVIPDGVTAIDRQTFLYATSLTSIIVPDSVISIGQGTFFGATSLSSVTLGNHLESIGENAFYGNSALTSIVIPNSVISIGATAFQQTTSLTTVTLGTGLQTIGFQAFAIATSLTSISIPNSVTSLGDAAFVGNTALRTVTIGNGVTTIGENTFYGATSLTSLTIGSGVRSIGASAFTYASSLTSLTFGNSDISIGSSAFSGASSLTSLTFGNGATTIGSSAFSGATSLTVLSLGNGATTIGSSAFSGATSLIQIEIPENVTSINLTAFSSTTNLVRFVVSPSNSNYSSDAEGVLFNSSKSILIKYPAARVNATYSIPNSVSSISDSAFQSSLRLTDVIIPSSVTSIGYTAFYGSTALANVRFIGAAPTMYRFFSYAFTQTATGAKANVSQANIATFSAVGSSWNGLIVALYVEATSQADLAVAEVIAAAAQREAEKRSARAEMLTKYQKSEILSIELFAQAQIAGITKENFEAVQAEIAATLEASRIDLIPILKIVRKYEVVGMVASDRVVSVFSNSLIEIGLITEDSKHKAALTRAIKTLPVDARSSYAAIKKAIDAKMAEIQARKDRQKAVLARIASRRAL